MHTKEKDGTLLTVIQHEDPKSKQFVFKTYTGDQTNISTQRGIASLYTVRRGKWKRVTKKDERVFEIPHKSN